MVIASFAGPSNSGKTTFLESLIPLLCKEGFRVGMLKHCHHPLHNKEHSDSRRLERAGAFPSYAVLHHDFKKAKQQYEGCDLLLVEGFRSAQLPTFVVYRDTLEPEWERPTHILGFLDLNNKEACMKQAFCYFVQKLKRT